MKKFSITLILVIVTFIAAFSQVPASFNYQAVVRNSSGEILANETVSFRISLLKDSESGTVVYSETHSLSTNDFGLVNLKIGKGTKLSGDFSPADWGEVIFTKTEFDPAGGSSFSHLATTKLSSVPYAFKAQTVVNDAVNDADADPANELQTLTLTGTLLELSDGGGSVTLPTSGSSSGDNWGAQIVKTDGTLTGNGTTANPLGVTGDLTDDQALSISGNDLSISGGNTVTLPSEGSSVWEQSGANIVYSDGSVNVGSVTPDSRILLQSFTNSDLYALGAINNGSNPTIYAMNNGTGPSAWIAGKMKITDGTEGNGKILVSDADGNSSWRIPYWDLDSDDHALGTSYTVRLGNASGPWNARIVASSYSSEDRAIVAMNNSTTEAALDVSNHSGGPAARFFSFIKIKDGTQGNGKILTSDADGNASWQTSASSSSLWTESGSNVYRSSGNVGIGTTTPSNKLQVSDGDIQLDEGRGIKILNSSSYSRFQTIGNTTYLASSSGGKIHINTSASAGAASEPRISVTSNGNIGIGATSPTEKLEVNGNISLASGTDRYIMLPDGSHSLFIGGKKLSTAAYSVHIVTNGTSGGVARLSVVSDKVGIGVTSPTQKLDVNGNARFRSIGSGAYSGAVNRTSDGTLTTASSDIRLKENISTLNNSLDKVMQLRGVSFTWKSNPEYGTRIGFIAQEFEEVIPELSFTNEVDGYKGINYAEVSAVLVEAVKEQQKQIELLKSDNNQLKYDNDKIVSRLEKLETLMSNYASK